MTAQKLTNATVKNAKSPKSGRLQLWDSIIGGDSSLPGSFGLRITPNGVKSWFIIYRLYGAQQKMQIGTYPALSLADAREIAREELKAAARGENPKDRKDQKKEEALGAETTAAALDDFVRLYAKPNNRSWKNTEQIIDRHIKPTIGKRKLKDIGRQDCMFIIDGLTASNKPYMANRVLAVMRKFFNWCVERGRVLESPVSRVSPPGKIESRDRVLNEHEILCIWKACEADDSIVAKAFLLMMITGQRRQECASIQWKDIEVDNWENLEASESAQWVIPKESTKAGRQHTVPLSLLALQAIKSTSRTSDYLFSTTGKTPISGFSKAKARIDDLAIKCAEEMEYGDCFAEPWRLHDLRRTVASCMAGMGIAPHVIEKAQNRTGGVISGVAAIYNRHDYQDEKRHAMNAWGAYLGNLIAAKEEDNIIPLNR